MNLARFVWKLLWSLMQRCALASAFNRSSWPTNLVIEEYPDPRSQHSEKTAPGQSPALAELSHETEPTLFPVPKR